MCKVKRFAQLQLRAPQGVRDQRPGRGRTAASPFATAQVLRLRNMRFAGCHGVFEWERRRAQPFEVDVEIHRDLARAGDADDLSLSVDYAAVRTRVEEIVTGPSVQLVEALAERIALAVSDVSGEDLHPMEVTVRVRKPRPPVPGTFDGVEVEIHRRYG